MSHEIWKRTEVHRNEILRLGRSGIFYEVYGSNREHLGDLLDTITQKVNVDHRGLDVLMAQDIAYGLNVHALG